MNAYFWLLLLLFLVFGVALGAILGNYYCKKNCKKTETDPPVECKQDSDCEQNQECENGKCKNKDSPPPTPTPSNEDAKFPISAIILISVFGFLLLVGVIVFIVTRSNRAARDHNRVKERAQFLSDVAEDAVAPGLYDGENVRGYAESLGFNEAQVDAIVQRRSRKISSLEMLKQIEENEYKGNNVKKLTLFEPERGYKKKFEIGIVDVYGDGLCFFHSVATGQNDGALPDKQNGIDLAQNVANNMIIRSNQVDEPFKSQLLEDVRDIRAWANYVETGKGSPPNVYPDANSAALSVANVTGQTVVIYDSAQKRIDEIKPEKGYKIKKKQKLRVFRDSYIDPKTGVEKPIEHFQHAVPVYRGTKRKAGRTQKPERRK